MTRGTRTRRAYHHGDLPAALVDATVELVAEKGLQGFSVAEAARRTGVSISAPYKHFADRGELLAACATRAWNELHPRCEIALAAERSPTEQLAAMSGQYVRFAVRRRALFEVLYAVGLEKPTYPELVAASAGVKELLLQPARRLAPREELARALFQAVLSAAHGHAAFVLEGLFGPPPEVVDVGAARAAAATRALVRGRSILFAAAESAR